MKQKELRVGICKHTGRKILQIRDECSDDGIDEKGWMCLHDDTVEEEIKTIIKFKYNVLIDISKN